MAVLAVGAVAYVAASAWTVTAAYAATIATVAMTAYNMYETSRQVVSSTGPRLEETRLFNTGYGNALGVLS